MNVNRNALIKMMDLDVKTLDKPINHSSKQKCKDNMIIIYKPTSLNRRKKS